MAIERWMVDVNAAGLAAVADALWLRIDGQIPCATCGGALQSGHSAWSCARCFTRGDALVYAALALGAGERGRALPAWQGVRRTLAARGLCQPPA